MGVNAKVSGKVALKPISFNQILTRYVIKNNSSSGKITLPKKLIGNRVIVLVDKEQED